MTCRADRHTRLRTGLLAGASAILLAVGAPGISGAGARTPAPQSHSAHLRSGSVSKGARLGASAAQAVGHLLSVKAPTPAAPATPAAVTAPVATPAPAPVPAAPVPAPVVAPPPVQFYVAPTGEVDDEESQLNASGQTAEATQLQQISDQPQGTWLTTDLSAGFVPAIMSAAAAQGTVPVIVLYNLPWRDCGGDSAGGTSSESTYDSYVNQITSELGQGRAYIVIEPDALSEVSCLPSSEQEAYYQMIGYATQQIDTDANASVYVDAGNPTWQPAATEAAALQQAIGSSRAGFSLNVSNYVSTATDIAYGTEISQLTGGRHFIIDTSRNGATVPVSAGTCNVPGSALGENPTTDTGNPLVDALLWIKRPGESDGECNGGPSSGGFYLSYALSLINNR